MTRSTLVACLCVALFAVLACGSSSGQAGDACRTTPPPEGTPAGWDVGSQRPSIFPSVINPAGTVACGLNRLMFSFLDSQNVPVAAPDRTVEVRLFDLGADPAKSVAQGPATFIWAIEPRVGVYVVDVELPTAGSYGIEFTTAVGGGSPEIIRTVLDVQPTSSVVRVGDKAPASDTPTLADVGGDVSKIASDPAPVAAFYETSIAQAIAAKEPFVVAFATPKFCASQQCGPTLDRLKPIAARHPGVTVINVEPYVLELQDGQLQPVLTDDQLTPAASTNEWRLPTEPWVFVVNRDGVITASLMMIFSDEELEAAITAVE